MIPFAMLAAALAAIAALSRRKWRLAVACAAVLVSLLMFTARGHDAVAALATFGQELSR